MAQRPTIQLEVSAHRFVTRRIQRALVGDDVRAPGGALPARSALAAGCLLAVLAVAGCAVLALLRPQPDLGGAPIVMGRRSGALYVRVGEILHPVLNLASARLIAGGDADPRPVAETDIGRVGRGPLLGIPGAPQSLGPVLPAASTWSVCDTAGQTGPTTTVIAGVGPLESARIDPEQAVPVVTATGAATYLLFRGRRMAVNPADPTLLRALSPAGLAPRRVSALLLEAVPEAPPTAEFPGRITVPAEAAAALCASWRADDPAGITLSAGAALPLPADAAPVALAQADGDGPALDGVYLPAGGNAYVRSVGVSGRPGGAGYLIAATGVRFAVDDPAAAHSLGLPAAPSPVPWPMLAGLPAGPRLSRQFAMVAWDVIDGGGGPS